MKQSKCPRGHSVDGFTIEFDPMPERRGENKTPGVPSYLSGLTIRMECESCSADLGNGHWQGRLCGGAAVMSWMPEPVKKA